MSTQFTSRHGCPYIELQTCSNYSFLRGASHPEELINAAKALGYPAIGLTDYHSFAGSVRAYVAAKNAGIRLLTGTYLPLYQIFPERKGDQHSPEETIEAQAEQYRHFTLPLSVLLYPTSRAAYGRLCKLLTKGKLRAPKGQCYLSIEDLRDSHAGILAIAVLHNMRHPQLLDQLERLKRIFNCGRLSLALRRSYGPESHREQQLTLQVQQLTSIPLVAVNDVHYHDLSRKKLQDVLCCIRKRCSLEEAGYALFQNAERVLKAPEEMVRLFKKHPEALRRTQEIATLASNFSFDQLRYEYPHEICPEHRSPIEHLRDLVSQGAKNYYPEGVPKNVARLLEHELTLIEELDYPKYFLTVHDIVQFARSKKILCQGRGAAANSAVCYVLGITAVNPDKINLLFERFISKERNEPPDIDIDFEHERREEVIQYIYQKYGRHRAALTAAVITYRTRSAVRDVGKVFGLSEDSVEKIIKLLTRNDKEHISSDDIRSRNLNPEDRRIFHTIQLASILHGFPRHLTQHVGGFIISESPLSEIVPIENAAMENRTVIEWDKDDIEALGMLKIDILALGMLTMIRKAFRIINERLPHSKRIPQHMLMLHSIPPEDPKVYDMICRADTIGVFQIESRAQQSMLPRLRPRCFYDLVIEVAIVRPGPIQGGMVHPFLKRRSGKEAPSYPNEAVKKILAPTLGVPIFQEQVMELAVTAAGFSPGEADQIRRALGSWKKDKNAMAAFGKRLVGGMRNNGYSPAYAKRIYEQIKGFSEYGFPQSHAASFALLVYVSAWLKHHHHAAFTTALLNSQPMGFYQAAQLIADAKAHGVVILPCDVYHSQWDSMLEASANSKEPAIRLGMRLIRGMRVEDAKRIARAVATFKERKPSLSDLWRRSGASTAAFKKLAAADAFQSLSLDRQRALWQAKTLRDSPLPLFENAIEQEQEAPLPPYSAKAQVVKDYHSSGFSLKAHPLAFMRSSLSRQGVQTAAELRTNAPLMNKLRTSVAGLVLLRQRPMTASGTMFMTLEDETGLCNIIVRKKYFAQFRDLLCDSTILLVEGHLQYESSVCHLILENCRDLSLEFDSSLEQKARNFH